METGSRQTYTGTKLETADTAKGSRRSTAPILDPTVGALGRTLNVQGVRLACGRRAPPRSGTFPYHSHLHEMRQIGSGMYGAIIVSDTPRDTTRDHVIVAGGGGLPVFYKQTPNFLLVNGRRTPRPITMTVGEPNRVRIVSIHADEILHFRFGTEGHVAQWKPLARDGADLPSALRNPKDALMTMGPGETADFIYVPAKPGDMGLEVWTEGGARVLLRVEIKAKSVALKR